jgi:hypothetical protein
MSGQGAAIGAATGATYALATGKDPVKYAMIGGAVGGTGGAMGIPGLSAGTAAGATQVAGSGSALTGAGASTGANTMFANAAGVNPGTMIGASQAAPAGIFANPVAYTPSLNVPVERSFGTLESIFNPNIQSSSMAPSFMEQVGSGAGQIGKYAQNNPYLTQMAAQTAQQALQQPEARMAPAGQVSRGEIKGGDYSSLLNPQQDTVLRPQRISLLG